jgi:hypothetical protein
MKPLGDVGHVESLFFLFGDSVSVRASYKHSSVKCPIGLEIILDTLDGTHWCRG